MACVLAMALACAASLAEEPLLFEAEDFVAQREDEVRSWRRAEHDDASGGVYLHLLPDTRKTHADPLVVGESFSNEPGRLAILDYAVDFPEAGRYYVWVRALSTGSEDNGIHVGLDGAWPESGRRMQWCEGKHRWKWESRQRTAANHCGEPFKIYLDINEPGEHTVSFSMREDGFRFDRFALTRVRLESEPNWP